MELEEAGAGAVRGTPAGAGLTGRPLTRQVGAGHDPAAAVERLKARLSDAFDRFLEGVADNRQGAFDDDGWRLKTDPAEYPDPAQSDSLALHRWLDAPSGPPSLPFHFISRPVL